MRLESVHASLCGMRDERRHGMAEYHGVFERKEVKYRLSSAQHKAVLSALRGRLAPDVYGSVLVKSVYFDTDERDMIAHSLEKPLYKEKLRVRSYGTPSEADPVFVEIKKKYDGRGIQAAHRDVVCRGPRVSRRGFLRSGVRRVSARRTGRLQRIREDESPGRP